MLIVMRHDAADAPGGADLGLVGKSITFDSGGYFLKQQADIVRQKADMGGGAAVVAAIGAVAELGLPLSILGVLPAAENMIGGAAFRPGDIIRTASGVTVEVTNPDAEGRIVMADALWFAREDGARRLVDVATLTGAMRAASATCTSACSRTTTPSARRSSRPGTRAATTPGRGRCTAATGACSTRRSRTSATPSGRSFGYAIIAASFLERFVDDVPWAHVDIHSAPPTSTRTAHYLARGASGAGVRMLTELATRLAGSPA